MKSIFSIIVIIIVCNLNLFAQEEIYYSVICQTVEPQTTEAEAGILKHMVCRNENIFPELETQVIKQAKIVSPQKSFNTVLDENGNALYKVTLKGFILIKEYEDLNKQ